MLNIRLEPQDITVRSGENFEFCLTIQSDVEQCVDVEYSLSYPHCRLAVFSPRSAFVRFFLNPELIKKNRENVSVSAIASIDLNRIGLIDCDGGEQRTDMKITVTDQYGDSYEIFMHLLITCP
jgi:hypothetical protein